MNRTRTTRTALLLATLCALAVPTPSPADTVAWWHFDECDPGTTAPANTVASDQAPTTYAHVYTVGDSNAMSTLHENSGNYLPKYTKPFHGIAVYDPVTDTTRTNRAAMKFLVERGGPNPDTAGGRARFGGALKFEGGNDLYSSLYGTSNLTVEAFVCTTGGVFNVFAPIVGSVGGTSWTGERWALYMETSGTIALRFTAGSGTDVWYSGNGKGGTAKVNDGAWHHVAFTYDGAKVYIYVDYSRDRSYEKTGTIPTYSDNATWVGGYGYGDANNGGRKYPGVIDEIRVSNATLQPEQFLRMQRLDADEDDVARVSFEPDEYGVMKNNYMNLSDNLGPNRNLAVFKVISGADESIYDYVTKAGDVIGAGMYSDLRPENVASYCQATNAAGKANYIHVPYVSTLISGSDGAAASYTIETFFKTRGRVSGTSTRQVVFKFGGQPWINVIFNGTSARNLLYTYYLDGSKDHYVDSNVKNVDDGNWHHVACVVDGTAQTSNICFYLDYRLDKAFTGTLPDVGTGNSLFFGSKENGNGQWFDGWLDDIRVTKRALAPAEFLTTHPVGSGDASLLALFENDYTLSCASNGAFSVTGTPEARTGGVAPTFVQDSRGTLLLDGTNGTERTRNRYSASFNKGRVVFPESDLYEAESYTVEFWAKFTGIAPTNGVAIAADAIFGTNQHAPILRLVRSDSPSGYDWYLYRQGSNAKSIQLAIQGNYLGWTLPNFVVDGKWHHYALTVQPKADDDTKTCVQLYFDYEPHTMQTANARIPYRFAGHKLMVGEGTTAEPNLQFEMDALRFSKGVLDPSQFLGREGNPFILIVR